MAFQPHPAPLNPKWRFRKFTGRSQLLGVPSYWAFPWPSGAGAKKVARGPHTGPPRASATLLVPSATWPWPGAAAKPGAIPLIGNAIPLIGNAITLIGNAITLNWALVSEPGFLKFQSFRFSILEILFWEIFPKIMLVRYRGINNKGVLERYGRCGHPGNP